MALASSEHSGGRWRSFVVSAGVQHCGCGRGDLLGLSARPHTLSHYARPMIGDIGKSEMKEATENAVAPAVGKE